MSHLRKQQSLYLTSALTKKYCLPEVRTKLLAEIEALHPEVEPMTIARLPYLNAVCQETLRLYPSAISAFPRVVKQPMEVAGYALEPGTVIMPSIYSSAPSRCCLSGTEAI